MASIPRGSIRYTLRVPSFACETSPAVRRILRCCETAGRDTDKSGGDLADGQRSFGQPLEDELPGGVAEGDEGA